MMVQKKRKTGQNKKTEHKNRRWLALLLIGVLVLPVLGQGVVAQETGGEKSSQIQKGGLRKAVNKGMDLGKENESIPGESVPQELPPAEAVPFGEEPGDITPSGEESAEMTETPSTQEVVSPLVSGISIYMKNYRVSHAQKASMAVRWDSNTKVLAGKSLGRVYNESFRPIYVGLAREGDKGSSVYKYYPPYTQSFSRLYGDGRMRIDDNGSWKMGYYDYWFQASTGDLLYMARTSTGSTYWGGQRRYDEDMGIAYTQPGANDTEHFKILADGGMRRENGPNFLASETTLAYLNTTLKVHENHMAVLGDDFLSSTGSVNTKIQMRLETASGVGKFDETTQEGKSYYESFKDIQGIQFSNGDKLRIFNYGSQKETVYTYNYDRKEFEIVKNNLPLDTYLIQFTGQDGAAETRGYEIFIEDGEMKTIWHKGSGILHSGWNGQMYLSIGIFKSNGDLKKKGTMVGGNHTLSDDSEVGRLKGTRLEDGDEIVLYATKDDSWDESNKVRVMGPVENAMPRLDRLEGKPGFNTKVFRYNATKKRLSQKDGTIPGMEGVLKSSVEEKLRELSLNPESNGDKKGWLLGLYSEGQINFGRKNIQELTGLEYGVNMINLSISDNPLKPETYQSLRNLKEMTQLSIGGIGLKGNENTMIDILVNLPGLRTLYAGHNGITNEISFGRLRQVKNLNLEYNSISSIAIFSQWASGGGEHLDVSKQTITEPSVSIMKRQSYGWRNHIQDIRYDYVKSISNIQPPGKGTYDSNVVTWSNLDLGNTELSYDFTENLIYIKTQVTFTGRVKRPAEVVDDAIITLDPNGGTIRNSSIHMVKGETAGEKLNPDVAGVAHPRGYTFAGWYRNDAGRGAEVERDTPINEDMTLYAKWEPPVGEYMIQLNGGTSSIGYDVILKDGTITSVITKSGGDIIHSSWGGKVYLSMGIFKSNGDLRKKATMLGGNHTISATSETGSLQGTVLENGDEIAIYAVKDTRWDEADKVRVIGDVEGGMPQLPGTEEKPGLNTKIFRYNATANKLSQVDGSIAGMEGALKSTVEEKLEELSLNPESNGDKKAWLLGLYSDAQIGFGNKNIQKLTGLEYGVNMTNISVSDNQLKRETYQSLRNLWEVNLLNIGNIGLQGRGKAMTDVLVSLPELRTLYAGYNGITEVGEFQQLRQLLDLNLEHNRIGDISPLQDLSTAGLNTLKVNNQKITAPRADIRPTQSYTFTNPLKTLTGDPVQNLTNIQPAGKGSYSAPDNQITWSDLETSTTELSYDFADRGTPAGTSTNFVFDGQVKIPVNKDLLVTFDPNGGEWNADGSTGNKEIYVGTGDAVGPEMDSAEHAISHPSGYRFAGWYETADGTGDEWNLDDPVHGNMTLYANWEYNNEAALLLEIPKKVDLKSAGTGEATGTGAVKVADSIETNLLYKNILIKATPNIRLTNPKTEEAYDVTVWKEDGSAYTDGSQPLMKLHPKGSGFPKEEGFTLKTPNLHPKKEGKYKGNMIFNISWE